ncbi:hypothetical protein Cni_G24751 [Canna indica]|uniref:Uncharacterized protein n=1 Tax=Canna indica TaxID=4628 RepID=A0AAQ3KWC2_9LILI|nr:hypothetical protein Cni_G24751 [Canna indica]
MALVIRWYDSFCLAIVGGAVSLSLWMIARSELGGGRRRDDPSKYESLLIVATGSNGEPELRLRPAAASERGQVGYVQLWMSCWRGVHPAVLLVLRLISVATMVSILSWDIVTYDASILLYYTEWTFALVIVYFAIATIVSAHGCWLYSKTCVTQDEEANKFLKGPLQQDNSVTLPLRNNKNMNAIRLQSYRDQEVNGEKAGFWGYAMQLIYQTSAGAVVLTDVVFWFLLVPFLSSEHFGLTSIMGCMHSLNIVFLLLDAFLNNLPFPWFRMAYFILWSCIYVTFQWVLHACGFSWWPYPFLELDTPWAPLWYFCMALIHVPCYGIYWLIIRAKNSFCPIFFPNAFIRAY